jgi:hypothetical protein
VTQISRLRQDFGVEKRRSRLERNRQQFFESMEPARRVNVIKRNGEDQSAKQPADEFLESPHGWVVAPAHNVIALVDRLEKRLQVVRSPGFDRGGNQDEW